MDDYSAEAMRILEQLAPGGKRVVLQEPLHEDESKWFLNGMKAGIVQFRNCKSDCPRLKKWGADGPDEFETPAGVYRHLFSAPAAPKAWLNREYLPHIAAYSRAILDFGYPIDRCNFSLYRKFTRDLITKRMGASYETDVEFLDDKGQIYLQIEAKASLKQTKSIVRRIEEAGSLSQLPIHTVKEIEYVLELAPRFLWIVGPGSIEPASDVFEVSVDGLNTSFKRLIAMPPSSKLRPTASPSDEGGI